MIKSKYFGIQYCDGYTRITNETDFDMFLNIRPEPPKRKIESFLIIPAGTYHITESNISYEHIYISFEKTNLNRK